MFTDDQVKLMRKIGLNLNFECLSDDDWVLIEETVGDYLILQCLGEDYTPNEEGMICYSILDLLP